MKDLRDNYNVKKNNPNRTFRFLSGLKVRKLYRFLGILLILLVVFYPSVVGRYLGDWFDSLYSSIEKEISVKSEDWYVIIVTSVVIFIMVKLRNFDFNKLVSNKK